MIAEYTRITYLKAKRAQLPSFFKSHATRPQPPRNDTYYTQFLMRKNWRGSVTVIKSKTLQSHLPAKAGSN